MARTMRKDSSIETDETEDLGDEPRRRGRPSKHPLSFGSHVTDETVDEFCERVLEKKLDLEKAEEDTKKLRGMYRAELKAAKDAGVDPDAITWWLKKRKAEPQDLNNEINWQNRVARLRKLPIGTQLGIDLATGETIASQVDQAAIKGRRRSRKEKAATSANGTGETDPKIAYAVGYEAGKAGTAPGKAGRKYKFTGEAALQFQQGWQTGQKEAAAALGPDSATAH